MEILACAAYYQSFMNLLLFHTLCKHVLEWIFTVVPPALQTYEIKVLTLNACWIFNLFLNLTLLYSYPLLNLILYIDLEWIIVNPFYPQSKRNTVYTSMVLLSFISGAISCTLVYTLSTDLSLQVVIFNCMNMFFSVLSVLLVFRILYQLQRQGTSWELKKIICVRYVVLFLVFVP